MTFVLCLCFVVRRRTPIAIVGRETLEAELGWPSRRDVVVHITIYAPFDIEAVMRMRGGVADFSTFVLAATFAFILDIVLLAVSNGGRSSTAKPPANAAFDSRATSDRVHRRRHGLSNMTLDEFRA